jgi:hypothetical protein
MPDESLMLALAAVLLIFIVFYVIQSNNPACFSAPSLTDKYAYIDQPEYFAMPTNYNLLAAQLSSRNNKSNNWSGISETDKTTTMSVLKNKLMLNQAPPVSATPTRRLINQEYGKAF